MEWRPDDWETMKPKHHPLHCLAPDQCVAESFEAGADAMYRAMRENGWFQAVPYVIGKPDNFPTCDDTRKEAAELGIIFEEEGKTL